MTETAETAETAMTTLQIPDWIFKVSIDKLTIVADIHKKRKVELMSMVRDTPEFEVWNEGSTAKGKMFGKVFWSLVPHYLKARDFRLEFNPNNLTEEEVDFTQEKLLPCLRNAGITRMDLAFDCSINLSQYEIMETEHRKKLTKIWGTDRVLETLYLGSRSSDVMIRLYDKAKERKNQLRSDLRAMYYGIEKEKFDKILEMEYKKMTEGREHWWRLEFEVKREGNTDLLNAHLKTTPFDNVKIAKPAYQMAENIQERAMLYYLKDNVEEWKNLSKNTRKKFRELQLKLTEEDITEHFIKAFKQKRGDLNYQISQYLSKTADYKTILRFKR